MLRAIRAPYWNRRGWLAQKTSRQKRSLLTLAIESSCDDTSVAILEKHTVSRKPRNDPDVSGPDARLHYHEKITSDNLAHRGVHPLVALDSHEQNLANLVHHALSSLPRHHAASKDSGQFSSLVLRDSNQSVQKPDFITVTRGPGMRSNLNTGLNTAKGLAVAWQIPLVAVNHMQAHSLTPRLASALGIEQTCKSRLAFPFLSLLVSGGHTMLIHSKSLNNHPTLAATADIAIGDAIDKMARIILPSTVLESSKSTMYGPVLEAFAFPTSDYEYTAPLNREQELSRRTTRWGWSLGPPLAETRSGAKSKALEYSFTGLCSSVKRVGESSNGLSCVDERVDLARESMRVAFEHLASRIVLWLKMMEKRDATLVSSLCSLVVSGGVAANMFLRHVLRAFLDSRGFTHVDLVFPPLPLCTDNAAMIAWAGIEMYEAGYTSDLSCQSLRKWSLDPNAEDGGILGVSGWTLHGSNPEEA